MHSPNNGNCFLSVSGLSFLFRRSAGVVVGCGSAEGVARASAKTDRRSAVGNQQTGSAGNRRHDGRRSASEGGNDGAIEGRRRIGDFGKGGKRRSAETGFEAEEDHADPTGTRRYDGDHGGEAGNQRQRRWVLIGG